MGEIKVPRTLDNLRGAYLYTRSEPSKEVLKRIRKANAVILRPEYLLGDAGSIDDVADEILRTLGAGALARVAALWNAVLDRKLYIIGVDDAEAEALEGIGAREADPEEAFWTFEAMGPAVAFKVRCMGSLHRITVRYERLESLDHTPEEIELLRRIGEDSECVKLHGRHISCVNVALSGKALSWAKKNDLRFRKCTSDVDVVGDGSVYRLWAGPSVFPLGKNTSILELRKRVTLAEQHGRKTWGWMVQAIAKVKESKIPWSPVAPVVAAILAKHVDGAEVSLQAALSLAGPWCGLS